MFIATFTSMWSPAFSPAFKYIARTREEKAKLQEAAAKRESVDCEYIIFLEFI